MADPANEPFRARKRATSFHPDSDGRFGSNLTISEAVFVGSGPGPIKQPAPSTITGTAANQPATDAASLKPFAGVVIADPGVRLSARRTF